MCSAGGPVDLEISERVKGKDYRCNECGEKFRGVGRKPVCPGCQSEDVTGI